MKKFFNLLDEEKIIEEIKPLGNLRWYFAFQGILIVLLSLGWIYLLPFLEPEYSYFYIPFSLFMLAAVLVILALAVNSYSHQYYWTTNKRIMYKRGIFGYKISSIPLERISDVLVTRTFFERIFGFGSVRVESLAGQVGREAKLLAIPDPEKTQQRIFELISEKRKKEKLTM